MLESRIGESPGEENKSPPNVMLTDEPTGVLRRRYVDVLARLSLLP